MRKLIVSTFVTLDGVMQAPGGPGEDDSGGFAHGGWSVNYWDEQMGQVMGGAMSRPFALVLGRKTYDIFAAHWPHATDDPGAKPLNDATKYVASRSHLTLEWGAVVLTDDSWPAQRELGDGSRSQPCKSIVRAQFRFRASRSVPGLRAIVKPR